MSTLPVPTRFARPRRSAALAAAVCAVLLSAGCSSGGGSQVSGDAKQTIRFTWWGNQARADATIAAVKLFEQKHPNITVETSFTGAFNSYEQKLATQVAGGGAPDVFQADYRDVGAYGRSHALLDLSRQETQKNLTVSGIPAGVLTVGQVEGHQYGVPMGLTTEVIIYDPAQFKKAGVAAPGASGWTWVQFGAAAKAITAANGGKLAGMTDIGWSEDTFESWLHEQGKQLYTADGKFGFTKADLSAFWGMTKQLRDAKAITSAQVTSAIDGSIPNEPLPRGLSAGDFGWDSTFSSYAATVNRPLGLAPMPTDSGSGNLLKPSMVLAASAHTQHAAAAAQLIDFLVNDPAAAKLLGVSRGMPVNTSNRDLVGQSLTGADAQVYQFQKSLGDKLGGTPPVPPKGDNAIRTLFQTTNEDIAFGKVSLSAGVDQFFSQAQSDL